MRTNLPTIARRAAVTAVLLPAIALGGTATAAAATVTDVSAASAAIYVPCHMKPTKLARLMCMFPEMVASTAHAITPR